MTIEQAKIEIEQLEPVADALWEKFNEAQKNLQIRTSEWSVVWTKIQDLKTFVRVSEATCQ